MTVHTSSERVRRPVKYDNDSYVRDYSRWQQRVRTSRHWRHAGLLVHGRALAFVQAGIVLAERPAGRKPWSRGRRVTPGPAGLAGQAFSLCFRVFLPDVVG
jgi:hypothetical protein